MWAAHDPRSSLLSYNSNKEGKEYTSRYNAAAEELYFFFMEQCFETP